MLVGLLVSANFTAWSADYQIPPEPAVKPLIAPFSEMDTNGNKVDDVIDTAVNTANSVLNDPLATADDRAKAQQSLDEIIVVDVEFLRRITQSDLAAFEAQGGQVNYIYRASYGWGGQMPRGKVQAFAQAVSQNLDGIAADHPFFIDPPSSLPVTAIMTLVSNVALRAPTISSLGQFSFDVQLPELILLPTSVVIEASSDLAAWQPVFTNSVTTNISIFHYTEDKRTNGAPRFYRAVIPQ